MSNACIFCFDRVSTAVNTILQKMCTILGLLKDLMLIEKLPDSCILQLVKTSFSTFLVDNIQLLQLKAIGLICGVWISASLLLTLSTFYMDPNWLLPF